jgi:16S rRNA G966 N2-methylase RsmD
MRSAPAFTPFDIVLFDPPYEADAQAILAAAAAITAPDGLIVLEHSRRRPAPAQADGLVRVRELTSGDSALSFYQKG